MGRSGRPGATGRHRGVRRARRIRRDPHRRRAWDGSIPATRMRSDGEEGPLLGPGRPAAGGSLMLIRTNVNGETREADVWEGSSLLSMLRDELGLPGSKNACEQ